MSDILNKILAVKREEVAAALAVVSDAAVRELYDRRFRAQVHPRW